jgi:putative transcriptional regulator
MAGMEDLIMNDSIKNTIRRWRFERNEMTQEELGVKAGVTRQTIIAIEAGKYNPSLLLAFRLAHALDVPITDLFLYTHTDK